MAERLSDKIREYLGTAIGRNINIKDMRIFLKIEPGSNDDQNLRTQMSTTMIKEKLVRPSGRNDGVYKVVTQVKPVRVFDKARERKQPFDLRFPKDFDTGMELDFAEHIVIREGDLIAIGGMSNLGKTTLALGFLGENIESNPVLMGNEYTTRIGDTDEYEPTPRFLNRLDIMSIEYGGWVEWTNGTGEDKFTLLPVREDYAEHIVKDRINIIDWINLKADRLYDISAVEEQIKMELGRGIGIAVLQKGDGEMMRGGQFTKDFIDCELLIDKFTDTESLLTIGKVKEYTKPVIGKTYAFGISKGVKIINFHEVKKCPTCRGSGFTGGKKCEHCFGNKFVDIEL